MILAVALVSMRSNDGGGGYLVPMSYGLTPRGRMLRLEVATVISQQGFSLVRNGLLPLNVQSISDFLTLL